MRGHAKLANAAGGVFAHGLAHLGLWVGSRDGSSADLPAGYLLEISPASRLGKWAQLFLFFFFLLRSVSEFVSIISSVGMITTIPPASPPLASQAPGVGNYHAAGWSALHGAVLSLFVPAKLGFTYVQVRS